MPMVGIHSRSVKMAGGVRRVQGEDVLVRTIRKGESWVSGQAEGTLSTYARVTLKKNINHFTMTYNKNMQIQSWKESKLSKRLSCLPPRAYIYRDLVINKAQISLRPQKAELQLPKAGVSCLHMCTASNS